MKNFILFIAFMAFSSSILADSLSNESIYRNIRESKSSYINISNRDEIEVLSNDEKQINKLNSIFNDQTINKCSSKIINKIENELNIEDKEELKKLILALRFNDSIDDVVVKLIHRSIDATISPSLPKEAEELTPEQEQKALSIYSKNLNNLNNKNGCLEDSYRALYFSLSSEANIFKRQFKKINKLALKKNLISKELYKEIDNLRLKKVHLWPSTLGDYARNIESLNENFPNRTKEQADLVTNIKFGKKQSLRQSLHERFNATQIMLMADMIKSLRKRLESESVTININYQDAPSEVITLAPMEKFRFILKLLRKEMAELNNSSLLNGNHVTYQDVVAASYEVGITSSTELDALAGLEDIWNPKMSKKEKAMYWAKTFGGIAAVFLPPPYGFISVLAIMIIDQEVSDPKADPNADYNLI